MQKTLEIESVEMKPSTDAVKLRSLDSPGVTAEVSRRILYDVNQYAIDAYYEPHRWHLGASLIGHECAAYLWFMFRWCGREMGRITARDESEQQNLGRTLRLFNRGHREEERFIEFLRGMGCEIWTHDTSKPKNEKGEYPQFRMTAVNGHFGGSLDGIARLPARYGINAPLLTEYKTNGTGTGFNDLMDKKVQLSKPQHFIQMSCYGKHYKLEHALYCNVNKNDDNLHVEVLKLNWKMAEQMEAKAERIITSFERPARISDNPTFHKCTYCVMKPVCHEGKAPERNCRSCTFALPSGTAEHTGEWMCAHWNAIIPREAAPAGCDNYKAIING